VDVIRKRVIVRGQVQGVGFRASARSRAYELNLAGIARNLPDGSVEIGAEGDASAVDSLVEWLREGPRFARVGSVTVETVDARRGHDFDID
jgi:acylphosphatase